MGLKVWWELKGNRKILPQINYAWSVRNKIQWWGGFARLKPPFVNFLIITPTYFLCNERLLFECGALDVVILAFFTFSTEHDLLWLSSQCPNPNENQLPKSSAFKIRQIASHLHQLEANQNQNNARPVAQSARTRYKRNNKQLIIKSSCCMHASTLSLRLRRNRPFVLLLLTSHLPSVNQRGRTQG